MSRHPEADTLLWEHYQVEQRESFAQAAPRFDYLLWLIQNYKRSGDVLDIGLGDGYLLEKLARQGYRCFGIDIARRSLKVNQERLRKRGLTSILLKYGNINNIPFQDKTFDVVTASEVLEHLTTDDLKKGIEEAYRVLKPSGIFVITVPADEVLDEYMVVCPHCGQAFHRWGHKQSYSRERLQQLFRKWKIVMLDIKLIPAGGLNFFGLAAHFLNLVRLRSGQKIKQAKYVCIAQKQT